MSYLPSDLILCSTIDRTTADGETIRCDIVIYFDIVSYTLGCRATWWQPAEGPEFKLSFDRAELDGTPDDAPGPLTPAEIAMAESYLFSREGYDRAYERARDEMRN